MYSRPETILFYNKHDELYGKDYLKPEKLYLDKDKAAFEAALSLLDKQQKKTFVEYLVFNDIDLGSLSLEKKIDHIKKFLQLDKDTKETDALIGKLPDSQKTRLSEYIESYGVMKFSKLNATEKLKLIKGFLDTPKITIEPSLTSRDEYKAPAPKPAPISTELDNRFLASLQKSFDKMEEANQLFSDFSKKIPLVNQIINHLQKKPIDTAALLDTLLSDIEFMKESVKDIQDLKLLCDKVPVYRAKILACVTSNPEFFKLYCSTHMLAFCENFPELKPAVYKEVTSKIEYFSIAFPTSWVLCNFLKTVPTAQQDEFLNLILNKENYFIGLVKTDPARYLKKLCDEFPTYKERFLEKALKNEEIARALHASKHELGEDFSKKLAQQIFMLESAKKDSRLQQWSSLLGLTFFSVTEAKATDPDKADKVVTEETSKEDNEEDGFVKMTINPEDEEATTVDDCEYITPPPSPR